MVISAQNSPNSLTFICYLLWHLKLNLYALFRMSYLIVSIIQNCILYLTHEKRKHLHLLSMFPSTGFSNDIFISGVWRFSVMQFQRASSKGVGSWSNESRYIRYGRSKKKSQTSSTDISLSSHNTSPFFQSWQGFIDVFLTTVKQKYSIWKQRNMYIASNIQGIYNSSINIVVFIHFHIQTSFCV